MTANEHGSRGPAAGQRALLRRSQLLHGSRPTSRSDRVQQETPGALPRSRLGTKQPRRGCTPNSSDIEEARQQLEELRRRGVALCRVPCAARAYTRCSASPTKGSRSCRSSWAATPTTAGLSEARPECLTRMGKTDDALAAFARAEALSPHCQESYAGEERVALLKDQLDDVEAATANAWRRTTPPRGDVRASISPTMACFEAGPPSMALLAGAPGSPPALLLETGQTERCARGRQRGLANLTPEVVTAIVPPPGSARPARLCILSSSRGRRLDWDARRSGSGD